MSEGEGAPTEMVPDTANDDAPGSGRSNDVDGAVEPVGELAMSVGDAVPETEPVSVTTGSESEIEADASAVDDDEGAGLVGVDEKSLIEPEDEGASEL